MESGKTTPYEIYKKAVEIETIEEDKRVKISPAAVTAVPYEDAAPANATESEDLDEDELQDINAIRAQKGKAPFQKTGPNGAPRNRSSADTAISLGTCRRSARLVSTTRP